MTNRASRAGITLLSRQAADCLHNSASAFGHLPIKHAQQIFVCSSMLLVEIANSLKLLLDLIIVDDARMIFHHRLWRQQSAKPISDHSGPFHCASL